MDDLKVVVSDACAESSTNIETVTGFRLPTLPEQEWEPVLKLLQSMAHAIVGGEFQFGDVRCESELKSIQKIHTQFSLESLKVTLKGLVVEGTTSEDFKQKAADLLISVVSNIGGELFHDRNNTTYITVPVKTHFETWKLKSTDCKRWLRRLWYQTYNTSPSQQVITEAIDTLDAKASLEGTKYDVFIRLAHSNNRIYVDLCNDEWEIVEITDNGWKVIQSSFIKFIRTKGMQPLCKPETRGSINLLRSLINAPTEKHWTLIVAWLLACFSQGPFPVLVLLGEQGSSKSFLCRILRQIVDPSEIEMTSSPKEPRDVMIAAQNSYLVALDNLSSLPGWLSDLLCGISTGAAYRERKYHTNDGEEALFKAKRPIVLNGIDLSMRDDLLSRSLLLSLPSINDEQRRDEKEILSNVEMALPQISGGIYDIVALIIKHLPLTKLSGKPRMADFALWATAAEGALGWPAGQFMQMYSENRSDGVELAFESDSFGNLLREFILTNGNWSGGWQDLIGKLQVYPNPPDWPKSGKAVANRLKRLAPSLRHFGIHYSYDRTGTKRLLNIWKDLSDVSQASNQIQDNSELIIAE